MAPVPSKLEQLAVQLKELSEALADEGTAELPSGRAQTVRRVINEAYERIRKLMDEMDPIQHPGFMFDPSNPHVAGRIAGIVMIAQPRKTLSFLQPFYGSGVYAIYYNGDFPAYAGIARKEHPIYVGKADPEDPSSITVKGQGARLARRLNDHRKSIGKATTTLRLEDFEYRALVVQTGWQGSAEEFLIDLFQPIWNSETGICYGIGKHGDDPKTRANLRSPWDTLHPGREWAHRDKNMKDARSVREITASIKGHFGENPPFESVDEILRRFLEEMRAVS